MSISFDATRRVIFHKNLDVMEVDFSELLFSNSEDVNYVYDLIEEAVEKHAQKWYFMVNYGNTQIYPDAWFQFSIRGKKINLASSLGSVRFDPNEPTSAEITKYSQKEGFNLNLVSTREEALSRIEEMKNPEVV